MSNAAKGQHCHDDDGWSVKHNSSFLIEAANVVDSFHIYKLMRLPTGLTALFQMHIRPNTYHCNLLGIII